MRIHFGLAITLLAAASACSPSGDEEVLRINRGRTQGTTYSISYKVASGVDYQRSIDSILIAVDRSMSAWNANSTLSKVNAGMLDTLEDTLLLTVLKRGQEISAETDGYFDMTIAALVNAWGFGAEEQHLPDSSTMDTLLAVSGYEQLKIAGNVLHRPPGLKIDVNAIAQGYTVDLIARYLDRRGVAHYLIEIGGEMRAKGTNLKDEAWIVGIDKPSEELRKERFQVLVDLTDLALVTSGNYRKFQVDESTGMRYSHTINPKTGYPVRDRLLSATVVGSNAMDADAYATACMAMGLDKAKAFIESKPGLEAYFVYSGLQGTWEVWKTEGFRAMEH